MQSIHKLTAGNGYTYLTQQVAAMDSTGVSDGQLAEYYSAKGESPGRWVGTGLTGVSGITEGDLVSEAQMKALFGVGRHPDADAMYERLIAGGMDPSKALEATQLG
ncbi:MAG: relaxase domain-containing protein, partial [Actinomycetota bacterium]|nr:relaxase domain-containing protein [Actinomycetota bacterium]